MASQAPGASDAWAENYAETRDSRVTLIRTAIEYFGNSHLRGFGAYVRGPLFASAGLNRKGRNIMSFKLYGRGVEILCGVPPKRQEASILGTVTLSPFFRIVGR